MPGQVGWRPLLEGARREEVLQEVRRLSAALQAYLRDTPPGAPLAGGAAGLALFFHWLEVTEPDGFAEQLAEELLNAAFEAVGAQPMSAALYSGFTGVAWAVQHLEDGRDEDDALSDVDAALARRLQVSPWRGDFDLINGLVGLGIYALERLPRAAAVRSLEGVVARLAELAEPRPEGLAWKTPPERMLPERRKQWPGGWYDLGAAHGMPGIVAVLAGAIRVDVAAAEARRLLDGAWRYLMAHRLPGPGAGLPASVFPGTEVKRARAAWCYGTPGAALALFNAARALGDTAREAEVLALAREAARRPVEDSGVVDAGLCHGSAGLLHIFNRFFQATGEAVFADAARTWLEHTLRLKTPGQGIGGYAAWSLGAGDELTWVDKPGLLEGTGGVALALLAAASPVEPTWDRVLLMSLRG
jgi:lantibiotic modifying enzyme